MNIICLLSEYYLSVCFFLYLIIGIFLNLSKKMDFPNYYNGICFLIIICLINVLLIDIWNRNDNIISYDLYKTVGDVFFKNIIFLLIILYLVYSIAYVQNMKLNFFEFLIIIFFVAMSFSFFIITIDIISFYLLLEIQSLSFYLLTAFYKKNQYSVESGLKYFILSSFSSVILLFGFSFIYGLFGVLNISEINILVTNIYWDSKILNVYILSILLILLAFLFKLYAAPFHVWVSDIYQGAPTMSTAFFGVVTSFPLFYIWIKYYLCFFSTVELYIFYVLFVVSVLSMFFGAIGALYQKKIKRLVAFSSVSNIGYVFIGFLEENPQTLINSFNYFMIYIISSMGIFVIFLNIFLKKSNFFLERLNLLSGIIHKNKLLALSLIVLLFTAAGMPPFSLFIVKILLLTSVSYQMYSVILFIVVFTSILGSFYYLRIIKTISFDNSKKYLFFSSISYFNSLIIVLMVLFQIIFFLKSEYIVLFGDYIVFYFYSNL